MNSKSKVPSNTVDVNALLGGAANDGLITQATADMFQMPQLADALQAGLGVPAGDIALASVYGQILILDDSSSIRTAGNEQNVRDGANLFRGSMLKSNAKDEILLALMALNKGMIYPLGPLRDSPELTAANFTACGNTPLYRQFIVGGGLLLAKWREFVDVGAEFRGGITLVSDGANWDPHSNTKVSQAAAMMEDLRRQGSERFFALFIGVDDGQTDFGEVAREMGFDDNKIMTPKNSASEIRRAFEVASLVSRTASQTAAGFSKVAQQGFGAV